ncbi:MAG: hypothetical protein IJT02_04855 [Synergistaceae bacterium]|nr:hypothetical protein [Synergistaceae bacterium]
MNELCFTVLGPSGCGKTTLLACMNEYFGRVMPSAFQNDKEFGNLSNAYSALREDAEDNGREIIFDGGVKGTDEEHEYPFTIKGSRRDIPLRFFDFPGEWLKPDDRNFSYVAETVRRSSVVIAVINSPFLMHYKGKYRDSAGINDMEYVIADSLAQDGRDKLILLVPVKCEKYLADESEAASLLDAVKAAFADTISLAGSASPYYGHLALAVLPVSTMGNVHLSRFTVRGGEPVLYFRRITGRNFMPSDTDQPLRYAMSFLLEQYTKSRSGVSAAFDWVFGNGNLDKIAEQIRAGIRTDIRGMEILAGRELLGLPEDEDD